MYLSVLLCVYWCILEECLCSFNYLPVLFPHCVLIHVLLFLQTCARVLRLLRKQFGELLQEEYKLPKIQKRYKGEIIPYSLPVDIQKVSKTRSSIHVHPVSAQSGAQKTPLRRGSVLDSVKEEQVCHVTVLLRVLYMPSLCFLCF